MLVIILVPLVILASTVAVFFLLGPALGFYFSKLEEKTRMMQKVAILMTSSRLVDFFSKSEASKVVETLLTKSADDNEGLEKVLLDLGDKASGEIEKLYQEVKRGYEPLEYLSKVKVASVFLRITVLLYGLSVSISEVVLIYLKVTASLSLFSLLNGVMFGGSIVSSALVLFIILYLTHESRKIDTTFVRLQSGASAFS